MEKIQGRNGPITPQDVERFWVKVDRGGSDDCWLWNAFISPDGYGRFTHCGRNIQAHQFSYELHNGLVPEGLFLDHVHARGCVHRHCVNPAHLEAVTNRINVLRGRSQAAQNAVKTHCSRGHLFDAENTYPKPGGGRDCRACRRDSCKAYRARRKAATLERAA
jgi:hypothetical protein